MISKETEDIVKKFRDDRNWSQFHNPKDLAISINLEAAELLDAIAVTSGFYTLSIVAIAVLWLVTAYIGISRYYKSLFTDEGYLNMVIPAETSLLLLEKLIAALIWMFSSVIVMLLSFMLAVAAPFLLYDPNGFFGFIDLLFEPGMLFAGAGAAELTVSIIYAVVASVESITLIFLAITVGSMLMRNHKIVGSVLFYFAISLVQSFVTGGFEIAIIAITKNSPGGPLTLLGSILTVAVSAAVSVALYFVNLGLLKNKFNIE